MLVGIHKSSYGRFRPFLKRYEDILDYNKIDHLRLDASEPQFWQQVSQLDLFIYNWISIDNERQIALTIIPIIEKIMGIDCYPNMDACWCYDDKIREYFLLKQKGFPIVESWVFWDKKLALEWIKTAELPVVFKLKSGAASSNVVLVKNKASARKLIRKMFGRGIKSRRIPLADSTGRKDFNLYKTIHRWGGNVLRKIRQEDISSHWKRHKNYVLFQRFLPNNDFDTRVTVIGDRAFAIRRFTRKNDFRASGSGKIDYDPHKIGMKCIEIAFEISKAMGFQSMAYDFLYDENGEPQFCEISYTYVDTVIYNCPGFFDSQLNWHQGHYWPQYFNLIDALKMPDLKQPTIDL